MFWLKTLPRRKLLLCCRAPVRSDMLDRDSLVPCASIGLNRTSRDASKPHLRHGRRLHWSNAAVSAEPSEIAAASRERARLPIKRRLGTPGPGQPAMRPALPLAGPVGLRAADYVLKPPNWIYRIYRSARCARHNSLGVVRLTTRSWAQCFFAVPVTCCLRSFWCDFDLSTEGFF